MESSNKFNLPERIEGLGQLSYNLWWSWHPDAREVFKVLDRSMWKSYGHNPVKMLKDIPYYRLVARAGDTSYLSLYDKTMSDFKTSIAPGSTWFEKTHPGYADKLIAYFSLEFAVHFSLPLYAGGLGVLAGDYCKEASDLGLPLVGVGLMYPQGYFHQYISQDGWQSEVYDQVDFDEVAVSRVCTADGKPLKVSVPLDNVSIHVTAWALNLGRVKLYLLDTNLEENPTAYRNLSARLYGGDREIRLLQELVIGIGGVRILRALGLNPTVWHANEGHTTFMFMERIREMVQNGMALEEAISKVQQTSVFTTHTPVPAGNDTFAPELIEKYFHNYWGQLKMEREQFLKMGMIGGPGEPFNMTVLGLKLAEFRNGVSKLHGQVCRKMWHGLWPDVEEDNVPIESITNGVHERTWIAPQYQLLFKQYMENDWIKHQDDPDMWQNVRLIPDESIWGMHRWLKSKLINSVLYRARRRWVRDRVAPIQPLAMGALLDNDALTIGFCRRFTSYKRASLILKDPSRLKKLINRSLQPVQIVFAGKAHPNDEDGKKLIQQIYNLAKDPDFGGRIAFIEDYDMHLARDIVCGVDVWLNTPRSLMEASGTSGQKASSNGVLNLSVLDGWWFEGYNGQNGWAVEEKIGGDPEAIDNQTAKAIYDLLEEQIIPLYYERDAEGLPRGWVRMMKETMRSNSPLFNTSRMAKEYTERFYLKAINNQHK